MAYDLPGDAVVTATIRGDLFGQTCLNTLHYWNTGGLIADGASVLADIGTSLVAAGGLTDKMRDCQSQNYHLIAVDMQLIHPTRYSKVVIPAAADGTITDDACPPQVNAVIVKQAEIAGRYARGTFHLAGVAKNDAIDGAPSATLLTALTALGAKLLESNTPVIGNTFVPVLWSRLVPSRKTPISATYNADVLRVLHRRQLRVGI